MIDQLLARQHECVGQWQLMGRGRTRDQVRSDLRRAGLRPVRGIDGVFTGVRGELTELQRWSAATRTAPNTGLTAGSACRFHRILESRGRERRVDVIRHGNYGHRVHGQVLVARRPDPDIVVIRGIPVQRATPALAELAPFLSDKELRPATVEALRLRLVTVNGLRAACAGRRGAPRLRALLDILQDLPLARCESNAEGTALVRLKQAGSTIPAVNVKIGGYRVDQLDPVTKEITEIDGPAFHADTLADAERDAEVAALGYTIRRRPSDDAYADTARW